MSKIIAWLVLIFVVLFALRMISLRNTRRQRRAAAARSVAEAMVRCRRCGVFLPRSEALSVDDGFVCAGGSCAKS